ncbi:hypothetical protein [Halanaeroarchaeum sp. HSR-CO]|uniref:hypothetical protein n=1 Tax=Halanaeroarchaeum sp. HSR-CO TaxID=2866382 RepID=UPI00217DB8F3|nr:hypothetical protein [Halanaeroarchaeum sp. HSR-CO]
MSSPVHTSPEASHSDDEIREFIRSKETFTELLKEFNTEKSTYELVTAVQGIGREIIEEERLHDSYLSPLEVGWLRLLWEQDAEENNEFLSQFK